jgi:hypothetical protein
VHGLLRAAVWAGISGCYRVCKFACFASVYLVVVLSVRVLECSRFACLHGLVGGEVDKNDQSCRWAHCRCELNICVFDKLCVSVCL